MTNFRCDTYITRYSVRCLYRTITGKTEQEVRDKIAEESDVLAKDKLVLVSGPIESTNPIECHIPGWPNLFLS